MEKRMALRRQRTRNRKYFSDDFTSIFTEKKHLLSNSDGYVEVGGQTVEVETVVTQEDVVEETVYDEQVSKVYTVATEITYYVVIHKVCFLSLVDNASYVLIAK